MKKETQIISKAIKYVNNYEFDKALDLINENCELLKQPYFMDNYKTKDELKGRKLIDGTFGMEWNFDQLINGKWWKAREIKNNTIVINKVGQDLIFDLKNLKAIKGFN